MHTRKSFKFDSMSDFRNLKRSFARVRLCLALCMLGLGASATAQKQITFITIDAPGAGTGTNQGTQSIGINATGAVTGFYADSNNVVHGYVRAADGAIIEFDAPGAGNENVSGFQCSETGCWGQGTYPISINNGGAVAGFYADSNDVVHGFVRTPEGKFSTFDAAGAGTGVDQGTSAVGINSLGVATGYYEDANGALHGFVRAADGVITEFDAPGAGTGSGQGTSPEWNSSINAAGTIAGQYVDANGTFHGFVRAADGVITEFDAPGAGTGSGQGTQAYNISPEGAVAGAYYDANFGSHAYVRTPDGVVTNVNISGAVTSTASAINESGVVTGEYWDASGVSHAFVLAPNAKLITFEAPGTGNGEGSTGPTTITPGGAVTGAYTDAGYGQGVGHGFVAIPPPLF